MYSLASSEELSHNVSFHYESGIITECFLCSQRCCIYPSIRLHCGINGNSVRKTGGDADLYLACSERVA